MTKQIVLHDAFYTGFADSFEEQDIKAYHQQMSQVIAQHVTQIGKNAAHGYSDAGHHYFCSTMMDSVFSANSINPEQVFESDFDVPQSFTNAYECACWGYCLQHHLEYKPEQKFIAISILDINAMEMKYWSQNDQWGKSGFGICTLFLEITDEPVDRQRIHNGVASGGNNIISFASFAKQVAKACDANTLSLPFFPDSMSIPVRRSLKNVHVTTERHDEYGHAFGSDPWIAFIRDHQSGEQDFDRIVFGSLALRGYYCFADIDISNRIQVQLN